MGAEERTAASIAARSQYFNPNWSAYYGQQCKAGVMSLEEWSIAEEFFRKPLPVSFRLNRYNYIGNVRASYVNILVSDNNVSLSGTPFLENSPYFGSGVRVAKIPPRQWTKSVQKALSDAQDVGAVNRQELCSMVPPILLQLDEREQTAPPLVLDLCSAPGSKTLQILDQMNCQSDGQGMLVANDSNRIRLLTVARRSQLTRRTCLVMNSSDGRYFPALRKWSGYKLKFDRVLADVPCSGDGTLRKLSSNEWSQWSVKNHIHLHKLQLRLLLRALELVKKGGRVVYSTCSLDPTENEAVVATAIARLGGPSVYRIVRAPRYLDSDATKTFQYSAGASTWVVPHPKFKADSQIVYKSINEVPKELRKKDVLPSMFPPGTRTESNLAFNGDNKEQELEKLKFYGDLLADSDAKQIEQMLTNCCRILPQHMDSGGFFCAIIERVRPVYYPVNCPLQREKKKLSSAHHGRIYYPVESVGQIREVVDDDKARGNEVFFEGVATFELAQKWLIKHGAYVKGRSEKATSIPDQNANNSKEQKISFKGDRVQKPERNYDRKPIYTPLFRFPHPDLLAEFSTFFGLCTNQQEAIVAGVEPFSMDNIIVIGGGAAATDVKSCLDPSEAHIEGQLGEKHPKRRFLQLAWVSNVIRSLFAGGAKFSPMDAGLTLCWVPVPGTYRKRANMCKQDEKSMKSTEKRSKAKHTDNSDDEIETEITNLEQEDNASRPERSGRYGLLDEAVEFVGLYATRRIIALTKAESLHLLQSFALELDGTRRSDQNHDTSSPSTTWRNRWGKFGTADAHRWAPGAVIAVCKCFSGQGENNSDEEISTIFLSCVLRCDIHSPPKLELLTKRRIADTWLRLLQST